MPFENAVAAVIGKKNGGPSIKMSVQKSAQGPSKILFTMNKQAVALYFPDCKAGDKMTLQYGVAEDKGTVLIAKNENGNVELRSYTKTSFCIKILAWRGYTNSHHTALDCKVKTYSKNSVALATPSQHAA